MQKVSTVVILPKPAAVKVYDMMRIAAAARGFNRPRLPADDALNVF